jgi:hypothetical protein
MLGKFDNNPTTHIAIGRVSPALAQHVHVFDPHTSITFDCFPITPFIVAVGSVGGPLGLSGQRCSRKLQSIVVPKLSTKLATSY